VGTTADADGGNDIVRFETPDVEAALAGLAQSDDAYDAWFRERVLEITGVDLAASSDDPLPKVILTWP
jgi:hypothetical protein